MNKMTVLYNQKTPLVEAFLNENFTDLLEKQSFIQKTFFNKKEYPDIYFHTGIIHSSDLDYILNAKKVIVNSKALETELCRTYNLNGDSIHTVYPVVSYDYLKPKESKKILSEQYGFDKNRKIIFFTATNLKLNGVLDFCKIIESLKYTKIQVIIAGDSKQIYYLRFLISKYKSLSDILFIENTDDINLLFSASDIFILPTKMKGFASNIIKAMFFKTAVFVTYDNHSSEIVDVYATMNNPNDQTVPFRIDALLEQSDELKRIKKQNKKISKKHALKVQIKKVKDFVLDI